jgi:hypothetical protein
MPSRPTRPRHRRPGGRAFLLALLAALAAPAGADPPAPGDPAARLPDGSDASEYWDLTASFASGHRLFARWLLTREGPGSRAGIALLEVVLPDGTARSFTWGRLDERWSLSADRLRLAVGSAVLDLHGPDRRVEIDSRGKALGLALEFGAVAPPAPPAGTSGPGPHFDLVQMSPVRGSLRFGDGEVTTLSGVLSLKHVWTDARESSVALRWLDFFAWHDGTGIFSSELTLRDGSKRTWLTVQRDGATALAVDDLAQVEVARPDGEADYPAPELVKIRGTNLELGLRTQRELLRADPLDAAPAPLRFLLSLTAHPRRIWLAASFGLSLGPAGSPTALSLEGDGLVAVTWLDRAH